MGRKRKSRLYPRVRGEVTRYWGDFRDFGDVGGRREPLVPAGEKLGTRDLDEAVRLAGERLAYYEDLRKKAGKGPRQISSRPQVTETCFAEFAEGYFKRTQLAHPERDPREWEKLKLHLNRAIGFFAWLFQQPDPLRVELPDELIMFPKAPDVPLRLVNQPAIINLYRLYLHRVLKARDGVNPGSAQTIRHHLFAVSGLLKDATLTGVVHSNAVQMVPKPTVRKRFARYLEPSEAALFLEAARLHLPEKDQGIRFAYPLFMVGFGAGLRFRELANLEIDDVNLKTHTIRIRKSKNNASVRVVPMWPQVHEALSDYLSGSNAPKMRLLFPSYSNRTARTKANEQPLQDVRRLIRLLCERIDLKPFDARTWRHTYISMRLQTVDQNGNAVDPFRVCLEVGHSDLKMIMETYGHLLNVPVKRSAVEYRIADYASELGDRLAKLRSNSCLEAAEPLAPVAPVARPDDEPTDPTRILKIIR